MKILLNCVFTRILVQYSESESPIAMISLSYGYQLVAKFGDATDRSSNWSPVGSRS